MTEAKNGNQDNGGKQAKEKVDLQTGTRWREDFLSSSYHQRAAREVARWVLMIFAMVLVLAFVLVGVNLFTQTKDSSAIFEFIKQILASVGPVVIMTVSYYLGNRGGKGEN